MTGSDRSRGYGRGWEGTQGRVSRGGVILLALLVLVVAVTAVAVQRKGTVGEALEAVKDATALDLVTVPTGTPLVVSLDTRLSTKESRVGTPFTAVVTAPVSVGNQVVIPQGARVSGTVVVSDQPGKASGRGHLQLGFEELSMDGRTYGLGSRSPVFESSSGSGKDAGLIGGGAIAGGILGGIVGGEGEDAAKGAVLGGAAGTVVSLMTRGPQITFEPGTKIRFTLDQDVEVREPKSAA